MLKSYSVYVHINPINGKKYVGCTSRKPEVRWGKDGKGYRNNEEFYEDIIKYGWNNFIKVVLYEGLEKNHAEAVETELIYLFNSMEEGYNRSYGSGLKGMEGELNHMYKRRGKNNPNYGKKRSNETKIKMSKPVICITTGEIFNSIKEASGYYNIHEGNLSCCCQGKVYKSCGKLSDGTKLQWMYLEDYLKLNNNNND